MKSSAKKLIIAAGLAGALTVGTATGAFAITSSTNFDGVANRFQQSRYFQYQTKTTSSSSKIDFTGIGGGTYLMNVKSQNGSSGTEYTESKNLYANTLYNIANGTPVGTQTRLIVTNSSWTTVDVSIEGYYITE